MITASDAKRLTDINNGHLDFVHKDIKDFLNKVLQYSMVGAYEFIYKPDNPLEALTIYEIEQAGFKIEEEGWKYKVSWR